MTGDIGQCVGGVVLLGAAYLTKAPFWAGFFGFLGISIALPTCQDLYERLR